MPNDARNNASGRFVEKYPREEFRAALNELGSAATARVAEQVGCDHDTAYKKLNKMHDDGEVTRRKIGNALLWSLAEVPA